MEILRKVATIAIALLASSALPAVSSEKGNAGSGTFGIRAAYVDFRAEVRTLNSLKRQADMLASQGMNAIIMEWEATFPFDRHATLCNTCAFTKDEVKEFVSYCAGLGIDVIPLQNCIGHSEYILRHERYYGLREDNKDPSQVCPLKIEEAEPVFREIFAEVAALHPSRYFHIGADETYLLGKCPECREFAEKYGKSRLFVDYVNVMCRIVLDMGKIPLMWADILLAHPEAVADLPEEVILVNWNYGWDVNRFGDLQNLYGSGATIWGASALRSHPDNIYLTQWKKHFTNLATFVPFARKAGYKGMIQTSWSTSGLYGFHYDDGNEIMNMQPVRLVYPESGFRILNEATARAFNNPEPLDPETFVREYASERFGFGDSEASVLWDYFCMPQETVSSRTGMDAAGRPVAEVLDEAREMGRRLQSLKPESAREEMEHLRLMLDIRINYLEYKVVETKYESVSYCRDMAGELIRDLERICAEGRELDRRFTELNMDYLKQDEIEYFCAARGAMMEDLLARLANNR